MTNKCLSANRFSAFIIFIFIATSSFPSFIIFRKFIPILLPFIIFRLVKNNQIAAINNLLKGSIILLIFSVAQYLLGHVSLAGGLSFLLIMITIISSTSFIKDSFTVVFLVHKNVRKIAFQGGADAIQNVVVVANDAIFIIAINRLKFDACSFG